VDTSKCAMSLPEPRELPKQKPLRYYYCTLLCTLPFLAEMLYNQPLKHEPLGPGQVGTCSQDDVRCSGSTSCPSLGLCSLLGSMAELRDTLAHSLHDKHQHSTKNTLGINQASRWSNAQSQLQWNCKEQVCGIAP